MWPFARRPTKEGLQAHRKVVICGQRFVIRRLSPLSDFDGANMPQIFTDTTRNAKLDLSIPGVAKRVRQDMYGVVQAGVVDPLLAGPGKPGLNVEDVFRDEEVGTKLYLKILEHSLLKLRPWQIPFFFLGKRLLKFIIWLRPTAFDRWTSPSKAKVSV